MRKTIHVAILSMFYRQVNFFSCVLYTFVFLLYIDVIRFWKARTENLIKYYLIALYGVYDSFANYPYTFLFAVMFF